MKSVTSADWFVGIKLSPLTKSAVVTYVVDALKSERRLLISYCNPNYTIMAHHNQTLLEAMNRFDHLLADGMGVVFGARFLGIPVPQRLGTDEVCLEIFRVCDDPLFRVFLLGALPGVAERAAKNLVERFPRVRVVGTHHGWFEPQQDEQIVATINQSNANLLLVCLGTPRQQIWVHQHAARLRPPVIMTGGGYLDNLAVGFHRYPEWADRWRLNWLCRLWWEPQKVWRRYTLEILELVWLVLKQKVGLGRHKNEQEAGASGRAA